MWPQSWQPPASGSQGPPSRCRRCGVHPGPACSAPLKPHTPGQPGGCVHTVVVFIRPPGCVHVQPDRLISKSQPSPSRHGSMSHHCFVLMIRAVDRGQGSARPGMGAVPTLPSAQPRPQGWEGGVGSSWGPPGGLPGAAPALAPCHPLAVRGQLCRWSLGQQGPRALGTCQGAPKAPSRRGRHCSLPCLEPT